MPSGLSESPGGFGSTAGGYGGGGGWGGSYDATSDDFGGFNPSYGGNYGAPGSNAGGGSTPSSWWGGASDPFSSGGLGNWFGGLGFGDSPSYSAYSPMAMSRDTVNVPDAPAGWDGSIGGLDMGRYSADALDANDAYSQEQGFFDSDFGKGLKKLGMFALNVHPATRGAMGIYNGLSAIQSGQLGQGIGGLLGTITGKPAIGALGGLFADHVAGTPGAGQRTASTLGGALGSYVGGQALGPFGAMAGGELGSRMASGVGATGTTPATQSGNQQVAQAPGSTATKEASNGDILGAGLAGLAGLYGLNRMNRSNKEMQEAIQAQAGQREASIAALQQAMQSGHVAAPRARNPNLAGISAKLDRMFGTKSEVAKELRSTLERKDAAAGRRSQYGPREVQLMAELTRLRAQAEPGYMNAEISAANAANQMAASLYGSQLGNRNSQLQQTFAAEQLGLTSRENAWKNQAALQQASDQRRMQTLSTLYGMGKETGFFNWAGNQASNWWNS